MPLSLVTLLDDVCTATKLSGHVSFRLLLKKQRGRKRKRKEKGKSREPER